MGGFAPEPLWVPPPCRSGSLKGPQGPSRSVQGALGPPRKTAKNDGGFAPEPRLGLFQATRTASYKQRRRVLKLFLLESSFLKFSDLFRGTYKNLWRVCIWACFGALSGVPLGHLGHQKQWEGSLRSHLGSILKGSKNDTKRKKVMECSLLGHLRLDAWNQQKAS